MSKKKNKKDNKLIWDPIEVRELPKGIDRKNIVKSLSRKDGHFLVSYIDESWYLFRGSKLVDRLLTNMSDAPVAWADHRAEEGLEKIVGK